MTLEQSDAEMVVHPKSVAARHLELGFRYTSVVVQNWGER
jgi:hypothetical protein